MRYELNNLEKDYELELDRILREIEEVGAKSVLLQLPDGLKPWGPALVDFLEKSISRGIRNQESGIREVSVMIWLGDCFGACDLPDSNCDLVVQFGHAEWQLVST